MTRHDWYWHHRRPALWPLVKAWICEAFLLLYVAAMTPLMVLAMWWLL